jgi:hypothetical protein
MTDVKIQYPTLFRVVTSADDLLDDNESSKLQYVVNAEFRGQMVTKQRVLKAFISSMHEAVISNNRHHGSFGFGSSFSWLRGLSRAARDELYERNVNVVSLHPGLGPMCSSHVVREDIHLINLVSMVTVVEHLVGILDSQHFRDGMLNGHPYDWVVAVVDDALLRALYFLQSHHLVSPTGVINKFEFVRNEDNHMALTIGGLYVLIQVDKYLQVHITYDQRTRGMVWDNYGADFVYA